MVAEVKFDSIQEFWVQVSVHCALLHWCSPSDRYFLAKISLRVTADLLFNLGIILEKIYPVQVQNCEIALQYNVLRADILCERSRTTKKTGRITPC